MGSAYIYMNIMQHTVNTEVNYNYASGSYTLARNFTKFRRFGVTTDTFTSEWLRETLMHF